MINLFNTLFDHQKNFQEKCVSALYPEDSFPQELPCDDTKWFTYHCLAMTEEMGEVLKSDKRWKTHRNKRYEEDEKLKELADVFITFLNMCIFSGFNAQEVFDAIVEKMDENTERIEESKRKS